MKKFKITYTVLGQPIPNDIYPEYNDGYNTKSVEETIDATNEDEVLEMFSGTIGAEIKDFTCNEINPLN